MLLNLLLSIISADHRQKVFQRLIMRLQSRVLLLEKRSPTTSIAVQPTLICCKVVCQKLVMAAGGGHQVTVTTSIQHTFLALLVMVFQTHTRELRGVITCHQEQFWTSAFLSLALFDGI